MFMSCLDIMNAAWKTFIIHINEYLARSHLLKGKIACESMKIARQLLAASFLKPPLPERPAGTGACDAHKSSVDAIHNLYFVVLSSAHTHPSLDKQGEMVTGIFRLLFIGMSHLLLSLFLSHSRCVFVHFLSKENHGSSCDGIVVKF